MTVSGTTSFDPSIGDITLQAFQMCGVRPTALVQEHFISARMAMNLMLGRFSSMGVNLWKVSLITTPLVQGTASYAVPQDNIVMLDTYIETIDGSGNAIDRIILPISRSEWASYPNKEQQGFPTVFWQDRLISSTVTLWPVPDGTQTNLKYYQVGQIDDAGLTNGQTANIPVYFQEAVVIGLALRLAVIWAPDRVPMLAPLAAEAYQIAAEQNIETSAFFISPQLNGYWRP